MHTIIIGGGVIGLSIAWRLAQSGASVTLIERGEAGRMGATWASAGLLAPHVLDPAEPNADARTRLIFASHALWHEFARDLEAASGMHVGYRTDGSLVTAWDDASLARLKTYYERQTAAGIATEWLSGDQARVREPHLSPATLAAAFSPIDHQVENRLVGAALREAATRAGVTLREHTPVDEVIIANNSATGVRLGSETLSADTIILAAGAWSGSIAGLPDATRPPVRPVKGQILALQMSPDAPLIKHLIWGGGVYIIPRNSGRVVIGATVEDQGFDTQNTAAGVSYLLQAVSSTLPAFADLPIAEIWAGSRPGSADDTPILGASSVSGLIVATGHFAHGIVLAPITAHTIAHLALTGQSPDVIAPFTPSRFTP